MTSFSDFTAYAKETGERLSGQPVLVEQARHIDATQHELFNYVADFDRSSEWLWGAKKSWVDNSRAGVPGQVGAVRMVQGSMGPPVAEVIKAYEAPRMLAYSANDAAFFGTVTDHLGVLTCEPHPDGGTVVCWLALGKLASSPAKAWAGKKLLKVALSNGMKNLERKFSSR